jgi:hypothetical protein
VEDVQVRQARAERGDLGERHRRVEQAVIGLPEAREVWRRGGVEQRVRGSGPVAERQRVVLDGDGHRRGGRQRAQPGGAGRARGRIRLRRGNTPRARPDAQMRGPQGGGGSQDRSGVAPLAAGEVGAVGQRRDAMAARRLGATPRRGGIAGRRVDIAAPFDGAEPAARGDRCDLLGRQGAEGHRAEAGRHGRGRVAKRSVPTSNRA